MSYKTDKKQFEIPVPKRVLYAIALISGEINGQIKGIGISQTTEGYGEISACTISVHHPDGNLEIKLVDKRRA